MEFSLINECVGKIATAVGSDKGIEFVQSEVSGTKRNPTVRVYIDKPGGVTLDDCSEISKQIETELDAADMIPQSYVLEVSSPGLERGLFKLEDFVRFTGHKVRVKASADIDGRKTFGGRIISVEGEDIILDERTLGTIRIPFQMIAKANLRVDLQEEFKRRQ